MSEYKSAPQIRFKGFSDAWEQRKLENIFNYERPDKYIVSSTEYLEFGPTPVLTANKAFILGYTTEKNKYINSKESIIFDDFTLDTKFVDFPYMVKSSAIKILTLKDVTKDNIRFNFELLSNHKFNMLGHARHYISVVQPEEVFTPNKQEQDKIGELFSNLDNLITLHQRKYDNLANVKKSLLEKMFPKNSSNVPEIRFKGFADVWEQRKLKELGDILTGSTPSTQHEGYYSQNGMLWVTPTDIDSNIIKNTAKKLSDEGVKVARIVPANTILVTCIASIGKNALTLEKSSFNQQINSLTPYKEYNSYFLLTESSVWSKKMKQQGTSGMMQMVNKNEFSELETFVPKTKEQDKIGKLFKNLDNLITLHQRKLEKLNELKKSMLDKMFI